MLTQEEYENIQRTIRESRYSPDDFEISAVDMIERSHQLNMDITAVTILFVPTKVRKTYISGFGYTWLWQFEDDLKKGTFDTLRK